MIKRICDLCTNDGEICHIARHKDADGDVVTIEAMLRPNYRGVVEHTLRSATKRQQGR